MTVESILSLAGLHKRIIYRTKPTQKAAQAPRDGISAALGGAQREYFAERSRQECENPNETIAAYQMQSDSLQIN